MNWLRRLFGQKAATKQGQDTVVFANEKVIHTKLNNEQEIVYWDDLQEIAIITTDQGPFVDDVFWLLSDSSSNCLVSSQAEGTNELLARLQELPGFDNESVMLAMASTSNAKFVCWQRPEKIEEP